MLRVIHCIYDDPANPWIGGGGAVRARELYRRLEDRIDATVVTGNYPGAKSEMVDGVRYVRLGAARPYAWSRWTYARAASRYLRETPYDAAAFEYSVYTPIQFPRHRPIGLVVHHLTGPTARQRWGRAVGAALAWRERRILRKARVISATSDATLEAITSFASPGTRLCRVGSGVPDDLFTLPRQEKDYLLFLGRLDWFQKGLDILLESIRHLTTSHPNVRLVLAGRGKDGASVVEAAEEMSIADRIQLLGPVSEAEKRSLLAGALLLVMPSRFEGFGMVAAEAMAAGVPVVASDAGSLPEVVQAPHGGRIVPSEDAFVLAQAIGELLDDGHEREHLSHTARAAARSFAWTQVAEDHYQFLQFVAATGRSNQ